MKHKVTIIIPTYNRGHLVGAAIESALGQDYPALDLTVVDDGSTDDTRSVLSRYENDPRITLVFRESNGGVLAAKNTGLDSLPLDTKYFGILDSDDVLLPHAVSALVARFDSSADPLSQVFGWCEDAETSEPTGTMTTRAGLVRYEDALCGRFAGEFWQLVDRQMLGDLRFDERGGGLEAMVWWPLMKMAPAALIDDVVRHYDRSGTDRVNRPSFTKHGAARKMWGFVALLERVGHDMLAACPERYASVRLEQAKWAALAGERKIAATALREAREAHPSFRDFKVSLLNLLPDGVSRQLYSLLYRNAR